MEYAFALGFILFVYTFVGKRANQESTLPESPSWFRPS